MLKITFISLLAAIQVCAQSEPSSKAHFLQMIEESEPAIEQALIDYQVPGLAIGVVVDGELVYAKGFGSRDLENKLAVTADTVFAIGSCSKAFTSFLAGTLVDEGLIAWDEKIIDIFPEFRLQDEHATLHLTMRDLLTHRSGLPRHGFMWYGSSTMTRSDVMRRLRYLEPSCDLRARYQYNDLMYLVAGCSMEKLLAKSWEDLVAERILTPLNMTNTGFTADAMQKRANFAVPYLEKGGILKRMMLRDISLIAPAGGLHSNVKDLARWVTLHLNGGRFGDMTLISPAALQEMHAPQTIVPGAPESNESLIYTCGLGWNIVPYRGHYYISHDGGVEGYTSVVGFFPREKVGIVILSNRNLTSLPRYLSNHLIDRLLGLSNLNWLEEGVEGVRKSREALEEDRHNDDLLRKKGTQPSHSIESYAGEYTHPGYGTLTIEAKDGKLSATINGLNCLLDHWHYDVFVLSEESQDMLVTREGTKFSFQTGINGEIATLSVPFEPTTKDIVFVKQQSGSLSTSAYLKQFVGVYEIYGYIVEIALRGDTLCGIIPGQPVYELVPDAKNEFSVNSLAGYSVRFVMDRDQKVEEVILVQPYGAFSAKPKR